MIIMFTYVNKRVELAQQGIALYKISVLLLFVLCLHVCKVRVPDSSLYCCICVTSFERQLTPLC